MSNLDNRVEAPPKVGQIRTKGTSRGRKFYLFWVWLPIFLISAVAGYEKANGALIDVAGSLGAGIGALLIPISLVGAFSALFRMVAGRWPSAGAFHTTLVVTWAVLMLSLFLGRSLESKVGQDEIGVEVVFRSNNSPFSIRFPGHYDDSQVQTIYDGLTATRADHLTNAALFRSEVFTIPKDFLHLAEFDFREFIRQYTRYNGLVLVEYLESRDSRGEIISVRGNKDINSDGSIIPVTYSMRIYFAFPHVMVATIASAAVDFPPPGGEEFLDSVRKRN